MLNGAFAIEEPTTTAIATGTAGAAASPKEHSAIAASAPASERFTGRRRANATTAAPAAICATPLAADNQAMSDGCPPRSRSRNSTITVLFTPAETVTSRAAATETSRARSAAVDAVGEPAEQRTGQYRRQVTGQHHGTDPRAPVADRVHPQQQGRRRHRIADDRHRVGVPEPPERRRQRQADHGVAGRPAVTTSTGMTGSAFATAGVRGAFAVASVQ